MDGVPRVKVRRRRGIDSAGTPPGRRSGEATTTPGPMGTWATGGWTPAQERRRSRPASAIAGPPRRPPRSRHSSASPQPHAAASPRVEALSPPTYAGPTSRPWPSSGLRPFGSRPPAVDDGASAAGRRRVAAGEGPSRDDLAVDERPTTGRAALGEGQDRDDAQQSCRRRPPVGAAPTSTNSGSPLRRGVGVPVSESGTSLAWAAVWIRGESLHRRRGTTPDQPFGLGGGRDDAAMTLHLGSGSSCHVTRASHEVADDGDRERAPSSSPSPRHPHARLGGRLRMRRRSAL